MSSTPTSPGPSPQPARSALHQLYLGRVPWDLLRPFPEQPADDRRAGDAALAVLENLLHALVDPAAVERTGRLPEGLQDALQHAGLLRMTIDPALGGLGLSHFNAHRVIEMAASWCVPVAFSVAITNGFGSGSYLPVLPDGPLKDMIAARVADGIVSAGADAEAIGTANQRRTTVAVPVDDGAAYLITGEKVFIGNGPVADLMDVSATVAASDGTEEVRLFFVDSRSPGFSVAARHEFMGLRGAAIGALRLDAVRVPAEHMLEESDGWRMRPDASAGTADLARLATVGRTLVIAPAALAIAKMCLSWSREFVNRRTVDGRNLGEYDEIQRMVATTAAEVFLIESVAAWGLLGQHRADPQPDLTAAKNLTSVACWRTVDRTMSLFGAEGYETAPSKARRGAGPLPVERAFRDARALRVAGGVDVMLDKWSAESALSACYYADQPPGIEAAAEAVTEAVADAELTPRCQQHLQFVAAQSRSLAQVCSRLTGRTGRAELFDRQRTTSTLGRIGTELLGMSVVLARAAHLAEGGNPTVLDLADIACSTARLRLAGLWPELDDEADFAKTSRRWLDTDQLDFLVDDVLNPGVK